MTDAKLYNKTNFLSPRRHSMLLIHVIFFKIRQKDKAIFCSLKKHFAVFFDSSSNNNGMLCGNVIKPSHNLLNS